MTDPVAPRGGRFDTRLAARRRAGVAFRWLCRGAAAFGVAALVILLAKIAADGFRMLSPDFFTQYPSRLVERAGIRPALLGSLWLLALVAAMSLPVGTGAAVYLEEYAPRNRFTRLLQMNIANLAGVPSIVYGILGLALFVRFAGLGRSLLAGAATLSLLVLPLVIISAQAAIRAVPSSRREAAFALGATRWQTIRHHVLPAAMPGILSGSILSLSRAAGETAPLIIIAGLTFVTFDPASPLDPFTVLPLQIFGWTADPRAEFHDLAAGGIVVLTAIVLLMNAAALLIRKASRK